VCQFCVQHGEGKRWYANARNYAFDLESDLRRRGFVVEFVSGFEAWRRGAERGLGALAWLPRPISGLAAGMASRAQQAEHFGQPVPLEDCARIFDLATNITRIPCVCRGAMRPGSDAESCCIVMTVTPHDELLAEAFAGYRGGPAAEGFEKLTKGQALALLRRCEERGLCHTAWTFLTPFVAAICNCNLSSGCMAMRSIQAGVKVMWRGEDVVHLDPERCSGCGRCVPACPFSALRQVARDDVALDRRACWGCGTCRAHCARGALQLQPRRATADAAALW
jgi:ferredoxin